MVALRLAMTLLVLVCASVVRAGTVSFEDLARHAQFKMVKIAPDGNHLAATSVLKNGQTVLTIIDLASHKAFNVKPRDKADVLDFWWASSGRVLYTEAEHEGGWDSPLPTGELWGVNASGHGSAELLYGQRAFEMGSAQFLSRVKGDPHDVLVEITDWESSGSAGAMTGVYSMDVRNGNYGKVAMAPMRDAEYLADHEGNVWFAWGDDLDGNRRIYMRSGGSGQWELLSQAGSDHDVPLAFSADDKVVWFTCPGAEGGFGICRFDPATRRMTQAWSNPVGGGRPGAGPCI